MTRPTHRDGWPARLLDRIVPPAALEWGPVTQRFRGEPIYLAPDDFTPAMRAAAYALHADTWTEPNPDMPEWHRRFPWWMCCAAARILADAGLLEDRP